MICRQKLPETCESGHTKQAPAIIVTAVLLSFLCLVPGLARAQTVLNGAISGTLTGANSPYLATGALTVPSGLTLTVEPNVTIMFQANGSLTVDGTLICQGGIGSPVTFTSSLASPTPGSWWSIFLQGNGVANMTHTYIEYAGGAGFAGIQTTVGIAQSISWNGGGVSNCASEGTDFNAGTADLRNLLVQNNGSDGLVVRSTIPPTLQDLSVNYNGGYAIRINQNPGHIGTGLSGTANGYNGIYVTGTLGGSQPVTTWSWAANANFPVIVGTLTISAGNALQIDAGSIIKFDQASSSLTINGGRLETLPDTGGAGDTWFTSIHDDFQGGDTNGNGGATGPSGGDWWSIFAQDNATVVLRDAYIGYGGGAAYASLTTTVGTAAQLDWINGGCTQSAGDGIRVKATDTHLEGLTIDLNAQDGFELNSTVPAELVSLFLAANGAYGGRLTANPGILDATITTFQNGFNGVYVTGNLGGAEPDREWTWSTAPGTAILLGTLNVSGTDTLNLAPGAILKYATSSSSLTVNSGAALTAPGGADVWITSLMDDAHGGDTNNDGGATSPAGGDGWGVFLQSGARADLNNVWFGYGGGAGYTNLTTTIGTAAELIWNGGGSLGSAGDGVRVTATTVDMSNLTVMNNGGDGVELTPSTPPTLDTMNFVGNGLYGMKINQNPGHLPGTFSGSGNGTNGVFVTGALGGGAPDGNWLWGAGVGFPYLVSNLTVAAADTLTLGSGLVIKGASSSASMTVYGTVLAPSGQPIWLTSLQDDSHGGDTNGDGNATSPAPGDWWGMFLQGGSQADLNGVWVAYGGGAGYANITTTIGTVNSFSWNRGGSLYSGSDGARVNVGNLDFTRVRMVNNNQDGLELTPTVAAAIHDSEFTGNGLFGLRSNGSITTNATGNWWGDASGPLDPIDGITDYNPAGLGQQVSDRVDYRPWLAAPPLNAAPSEFLALTPGYGQVFNSGPVPFTWSASIDPDGEGVLYRLEISRTAAFDDIYIIQFGLPFLSTSVDASLLELNHTSYWRVVATDGYGGQTVSNPSSRAIIRGVSVSAVGDLPGAADFALHGAVPNPFNPLTKIAFDLPVAVPVTLRVYDLSGRLVRSLLNGEMGLAGANTVAWNGLDDQGRQSASGVYFYRLETPTDQARGRMTLVK